MLITRPKSRTRRAIGLFAHPQRNVGVESGHARVLASVRGRTRANNRHRELAELTQWQLPSCLAAVARLGLDGNGARRAFRRYPRRRLGAQWQAPRTVRGATRGFWPPEHGTSLAGWTGAAGSALPVTAAPAAAWLAPRWLLQRGRSTSRRGLHRPGTGPSTMRGAPHHPHDRARSRGSTGLFGRECHGGTVTGLTAHRDPAAARFCCFSWKRFYLISITQDDTRDNLNPKGTYGYGPGDLLGAVGFG
jgi:hypothetical protein